MTFNIIEYKKSILGMFNELTEIEIEITKSIIRSNPEKNSDIGTVYIMAINRCRQILETILRDIKDE